MKTLDEQIAVMQAARDGAEIECANLGDIEWQKKMSELNSWNWLEVDYRVKPQPQVFYVNKYPHTGHRSREDAESSAQPDRIACIRIEYMEGQFDD